MAFAAPASVQNMTSTTVDMLPTLTAALAKPLRKFRIPGRPSETRTSAANPITSDATKPPTPANSSSIPPSAIVPEPLRDVAMNRLRATAGEVSLASLGSASLFASLPRSRESYSPVTLRLPSFARASRQFSTAARLGPFKLRAIPQYRSILQQTRGAATAHTSHNLLAHMEQTANNNPSSATAQNAFYSALLRANMPEIVVERYETGRYATNAACDAMYHRALERFGQHENAAPIISQPQHSRLTQEQLQAVGRAAVASTRGASSASARTGNAETGAKESPLHVVIDESLGMTIFRWCKFLLAYGMIGYFVLVLLSVAVEASGLLRKVGGPQNSEVKPEQQKARFSDVQGCDEAKEELQEVVEFLKNPDKFNSLGGKLPKGVLMIGPPGTGKTLLARAVAGEAGVPFFYMSGSEFDEIYVGVGAKRVRELFNSARAKAPAIVFIDELDAIGGKRNERDAAYHMQTLNQLLTDLDGFDQSTGVVFLAATNFPQMLDKALTRPGRFDRQIHVPLPDVRGRIDILKYHMRNMQIATDVDASVIARGTSGFSGADLENLVNQGAVHASKAGAKKVSMADLEWAKDRILMGAEKKNAVIQEKDKINTAYHEAGHALVAMYTAGAYPLYKCTIMPRGYTLGVTSQLPELDKVSQTKAEFLASIDIFMGGKIAEEILFGPNEVTSGCSSDLNQATAIAYSMVTQYGMSDALGAVAFEGQLYNTLSSETKQKIENEVRRLLNDGQDRARSLLLKKRNELDLLANALLEYETLNKEEMEKVVRGEKLTDKVKVFPGVPLKLPDLPRPSPFGPSGGNGGEEPPRPIAAGT